MSAPAPEWDPVMLEVYLMAHDGPEPDEDLKLELRRAALQNELGADQRVRRLASIELA